jgi:2-oxoglutarate dehydrogenase E1 component
MQKNSMELLWKSSHISGGNATYVEELYEAFLTDPNAVSDEWRS